MKKILFFILICFTVNTITAKDNVVLIKEALTFLSENTPNNFIEKYTCKISKEIKENIKQVEDYKKQAREKGDALEEYVWYEEEAAIFLKDYLKKLDSTDINIVTPEQHKTHDKFLGSQYYFLISDKIPNTAIYFHIGDKKRCLKVMIYISKDNQMSNLGYIGH